MSDNALAGYLGQVFISDDGGANYVAVGEMTDFKPTRARKTVDSTSHSDVGNESFKSTTKSWSATLDMLYVLGDAAQGKLSAAFQGATKLKWRFDPNGTAAGKPRFSGDGIIESIAGPDSPTADLVKLAVTIKGSGDLTEGTQ